MACGRYYLVESDKKENKLPHFKLTQKTRFWMVLQRSGAGDIDDGRRLHCSILNACDIDQLTGIISGY